MRKIANETTTTSLTETIHATVIDPMIIQEARPYIVMKELFRYQGPATSNTADWLLWDDPGAAAASVEGTGLSNTQLTTARAQATLGTVGMVATVTDEAKAASVLSVYDEVSGVLNRSVAEKYETDMTALVDDFSNTSGPGSGNDGTVASFLDAVTALQGRDQTGEIVAALHTRQTGDFAQDMVTTTSAWTGSDSANIAGKTFTKLDGYWDTLFGVPIFHTSLVPTANAGADRAGGIFIRNLALGFFEQWAPRSESDRDISMPGLEIACTARYGVGEIRDAAGQTYVSDA